MYALSPHIEPPQFPAPTSVEEVAAFIRLQNTFIAQYRNAFPDPLAPKTIIVLPSTTLDQDMLGTIPGEIHYEERMLSLLMLLRMPRTHIVYLTSTPLDPVIVDYYLHLLPGITGWHARQRLTLLSCYDASLKSLTEKILERPLLMERIRQCIPHGHAAHIAAFNVTPFERTLSVRLGVPLYGCDPELMFWGSKSGSRMVFREAGVDMPPGFENLRSEADVIEAIVEIKRQLPETRKMVVKMNEGFSGEGNAIVRLEQAPSDTSLKQWLENYMPKHLKMVAPHLDYSAYMAKISELGGIVETFVEGEVKNSPSVQCRINPLGEVEVVSTHDQVLDAATGQIFLGAKFPADPEYSREIAQNGLAIGKVLQSKNVMGRFAVDFISVKQGDHWKHFAIEINLRKGGTTHPYLMLQFLTDGRYNPHTGLYETLNGQNRFYFATDNLKFPHYKGITPPDLIDLAMCENLHYESTDQEGVVFHLIGALSEFGKLGVVSIGRTPERAVHFFEQTRSVLDTVSARWQ
ncbi:MAG TPA: peptide ligase PGM1-related protein [Rhodothermales bacterium]|nr:peptide ligase PGM1-related protein [Rhodothermales bacterium]HRR10258.1 peptide ligase PGM1-related protein [Rhodothermales bacterium]